MKTSKSCPKCQKSEIYTNQGLTKRGDRAILPLSSFGRLFITTYICAECGYIEEYVENEELNNEKKMIKLRKNWKALNKS